MPAPTVTTTGPNGPYNERGGRPGRLSRPVCTFSTSSRPQPRRFRFRPRPCPGDANALLLRELIDVQREQLAYLRAAPRSPEHDGPLASVPFERWAEEFPGVGEGCQKSFPMIERAFFDCWTM